MKSTNSTRKFVKVVAYFKYIVIEIVVVSIDRSMNLSDSISCVSVTLCIVY